MQATAADIEMFYDHLLTNVDRNTARLKVAGLKKFFAGVEKVTPLIESPFKTMMALSIFIEPKIRMSNRQ